MVSHDGVSARALQAHTVSRVGRFFWIGADSETVLHPPNERHDDKDPQRQVRDAAVVSMTIHDIGVASVRS